MKNKVVITGGYGFIGVNLVTMLHNNYDITVIDNGSLGAYKNLISDLSNCVDADITDRDSICNVISQNDYVVHLAACGSVIDSISDPETNFTNNVKGTFNIVNLSALSGIKHLIFASTGGALIGNAIPPVDESSLPSPISPYGSSKLCGEAYCHGFSGISELKTTILRFANIYGPYSENKKGAVTTFIKSLINNQPINIYGDGSASRDYLYVDDLCTAISNIIEKPSDSCEVYHLATGIETSINKLVKLLCEIADKPDHQIQYLPGRKGEVERNYANFDKANKIFNFKPGVNLNDGLKKTWDYFKTL